MKGLLHVQSSIAYLALSLGSMILSSTALPPATVTGTWITPDHSMVRVYTCAANNVCARLVQLADHVAVDSKNPDSSLRKRQLCGIELGKEFSLVDASHAKNGKLYDPDSGKTYSAEMTSEGDVMKVRGYLGVSMFGRTEFWYRSLVDIAACKQ